MLVINTQDPKFEPVTIQYLEADPFRPPTPEELDAGEGINTCVFYLRRLTARDEQEILNVLRQAGKKGEVSGLGTAALERVYRSIVKVEGIATARGAVERLTREEFGGLPAWISDKLLKVQRGESETHELSEEEQGN